MRKIIVLDSMAFNRKNHEVDYKVVNRDAWRRYSIPEDMQTRGICGSGILDVLAQLFLAGVVKKRGAFS